VVAQLSVKQLERVRFPTSPQIKLTELIMPIRKREVVVTNKAQCKLCGDVIESTHGHDYVRCGCGEIAVDGGKQYLRRTAKDLSNIIELSETYEEEYESQW
jgi:tRNA(Ile2) C34 agmatinyltransferase TiaS